MTQPFVVKTMELRELIGTLHSSQLKLEEGSIFRNESSSASIESLLKKAELEGWTELLISLRKLGRMDWLLSMMMSIELKTREPLQRSPLKRSLGVVRACIAGLNARTRFSGVFEMLKGLFV